MAPPSPATTPRSPPPYADADTPPNADQIWLQGAGVGLVDVGSEVEGQVGIGRGD
ncbi:hypothetical protein TIFTF001_011227 [Ficus carica]|uniref:Uncharacterized protein n=1 Tax=Ficus carica TaxID=3494 RepID=A0AA87ZXU3_FICCA|nr:hypothetical protein TIFTF001_011227 [Ficus carica]